MIFLRFIFNYCRIAKLFETKTLKRIMRKDLELRAKKLRPDRWHWADIELIKREKVDD